MNSNICIFITLRQESKVFFMLCFIKVRLFNFIGTSLFCQISWDAAIFDAAFCHVDRVLNNAL